MKISLYKSAKLFAFGTDSGRISGGIETNYANEFGWNFGVKSWGGISEGNPGAEFRSGIWSGIMVQNSGRNSGT